MVGKTIGHYRVLEKLGEGGMGAVYKAVDTRLDRLVALKFLAAHLLNDSEAKARFMREAKAAAGLDHPNVCTVYEVGMQDDKTFLSMSFLHGKSLDDRISGGPLPLNDALEIGRQVAEGLEAAHENGIVHRDIKPANVMIDAKGHATILDFGLARLTEASMLTRADQTVGTAAYMSPEQIQGAAVDHRTDIWALGCVLYEMVAGVRPFKGQYDQALAYEIVQEQPEPLTAVRAGVPMELEFIVGKCLQKNPERRYKSTAEIATDLRNLAAKINSGHSTAVHTKTLSALASSVPTSGSPASFAPARSLRMWQLLAGVMGLVALVLAVIVFTDAGLEAPPKLVRRFSFQQKGVRNYGAVNISPDGRYIAFTAQSGDGGRCLWVRPLGSEGARELRGTQGAIVPVGG